MLLSACKRKFYQLGCLLILISGCKSEPVSYTSVFPTNQNTQNRSKYLEKLKAHQLVKIACEGTSLTYGQNVPGPLPPINGASQTRAYYQYPEVLQTELLNKGINAQVINRGFPGDRTIEGLVRWRDSTIADVCIIEYGTNDAYNYGGYSTGKMTIPAFTDSLTKIVERRLNQGAWVIITVPPNLNPPDLLLNGYISAIKSISQAYGLPVFNVQKSVITSKYDYFDPVHLKALAYQKWGIEIAHLLY